MLPALVPMENGWYTTQKSGTYTTAQSDFQAVLKGRWGPIAGVWRFSNVGIWLIIRKLPRGFIILGLLIMCIQNRTYVTITVAHW